MRITLKVWRQKDSKSEGRFVTYEAPEVNEHMSFLEMLDVLNESLIARGEDPVAFDSDCREGICGTCGFLINGVPHGPDPGTTVWLTEEDGAESCGCQRDCGGGHASIYARSKIPIQKLGAKQEYLR